MKPLRLTLALTTLLLVPALTQAQDFGVMESAETINQGNFKLKVNPMFLFGDGDTQTGVAGAVGYGFTPRFDFEANLAAYDGTMLVGANVEYWLLKGKPGLDVSASAGFHYANTDFVDQTGVDITVIASHAATRRLDVYGALDLAFNKYKGIADSGYTQAHIVPGIEYKIHNDLDFLAELGLALNDNGSHYASIGVAYYLR